LQILKEIISFWRESQQRNMSPGQKNSASGDEENQTDSKSSGKGTLLSKVSCTSSFNLRVAQQEQFFLKK
jgi:hypothetical protein